MNKNKWQYSFLPQGGSIQETKPVSHVEIYEQITVVYHFSHEMAAFQEKNIFPRLFLQLTNLKIKISTVSLVR